MTSEQLRRAVWVRQGLRTCILKARIKDGGEVLARIKRDAVCFWQWEAAGTAGQRESEYAAMRAVRKALRDNGEPR